MSISSYSCKFKTNRQFLFEIESRIDELADIETKICANLMKNPDCVQEASQPFIDTNPDYVNPLKLKDNSSRKRVFEHIEEAELLAENNSDYVMQPFPLFDNVSWTLESQIPIKRYEFTPSMDLDSHLFKAINNTESNFLSSLLPIITSKNKELLDLVPIQDTDKEFPTFEEFSSLANMFSCDITNSNIGAGVRNTQLQAIAEEYCEDNKSVDVSPVKAPIANKNDIIDLEHPEVNICLNNFASKDEVRTFNCGVVSGKGKEILKHTPENQPNDCIMNVFSRNFQRETNEFYWPVQATNNAEDKKTNLKFQYAAVVGENLKNEIPNSEDCIILVCKECGFQEYI